MSNRDNAIKQLQRTFGQLDKDVLESVLEITNNDVAAATAFLQAEAGGYAFDPAQQNAVPRDYPQQAASSAAAPRAGVAAQVPSADMTPEQSMKALFVNDSSFQEHYDAQCNHYNTYTAVVVLLSKFHVEISKSSKIKMLAAAWARNDETLVRFLLAQEEAFNLPQVLGALNLLDAGRKVRAIEKRITRLQAQGSAKPRKIGKLRSQVNDLNREAHIGSVSGALAKKVRRWVKSIEAEKLTFYALNLPKAPWRELADLIHLNPKSDFQCPFLELAFDETPSEDSMLAQCSRLNAENVVEISKRFHVPYSYLRLQVKPLPEAAKEAIASYAPLDTLIWYHEELGNAAVNRIIEERLDKGEEPKFGYGKLMERLLYFRRTNATFYPKMIPIAERRMGQIRLALESPVTVIGDASYSMDVAIRCATIIGSVLALLTNADLKFFHSECFDPVVIPRTIPQVLEVATTTRADGLTAPACSLMRYYMERRVVKFFIVVTDEIENEKYAGYYFPTLFQKYHKEVYPAKIVFVSFLENPSIKGRMVSALENMGIVPMQFKLDGNRPDLQKLDSLLGLLATESSAFFSQINKMASDIETNGLRTVLDAGAVIPITADDKSEISSSSSSSTAAAPAADLDVQTFLREQREAAEQRSEAAMGKGKEKSDLQGLCVVCEDRRANMCLLECGHLCLCEPCAPEVVARNSCPLCRSPIARSIKVYQPAV